MKRRSGLKSILIIFLLITGLLLSGSGAGYAAESAFVDLSSAQTDYPYVKYLVDRGVINGYGDGTFRPAARLSRAEMAVLMVRANNLDTSSLPAAPHYQDVSPEFWGYASIEAATAAGYLKGYADGTFRPDEPVSRAEAAAIILRMTSAPLPEVELPSVVTDVPSNHWARQVVAVAIDSAIMPLAAKTGFAPDIPASRAEAARGLAIMLNVMPEKAHVPLNGTLVPLRGKVILKVNGSSREITAATPCSTGCVIETGKDGKAEIRFPDGSGIKIGSGTNITIKAAQGQATILKDGSAGALIDNLEIELKQGQIMGALATTYNNEYLGEEETAVQTGLAGNGRYRHAVASVDDADALRLAAKSQNASLPWYKDSYKKKVRVKVDMPWGVAAVRGTIWMNGVSASGQSTSVVDGSVDVSSGGQSVSVQAGQGTQQTSAGQPPAPPQPMTPEQQQAFVQEQDWIVERVTTIQQAAPVVAAPPTVQQQQQQAPAQAVVPPPPQQAAPASAPPAPAPAPPTNGPSAAEQTLGNISRVLETDISPNPSTTPTSPPPSSPPPSGGSSGGGGSSSDTTAPSAPENVSAQASGEGSITVTWDASTDNVGVTSYKVYVATDADGPFTEVSVGKDVRSYTVNDLKLGETRYFYIKAIDAAGNLSAASATVSDTVPAILISSIEGSNSKVTITFGKTISEAYIDTTSSWVPVVTFADNTSYKLDILDAEGNYSMCLHSVKYTAGTNTMQIITPGAQTGMQYNMTVYKGADYTQVEEIHSFTFPEDELPPEYIAEYPKVENISYSTAELAIQTHEKGKAYYVALLIDELSEHPESEPATVDSVINWDPHGQLSSWSGSMDLWGDPAVVTLDDLIANSSYKVYVVAEDDYNNLTPITIIEFRTLDIEGGGGGSPVTDAYYIGIDSNSPGGPAFAYNNISTGYDDYDQLWDDTYIKQDIGFTFSFYGVDYNKVYIGTNGYLTFGEGDAEYENYEFPANGCPRIAPFFDDLMPNITGSGIYRKVEGTAPNRKLIVQWRLQDKYPSSPETVDFEAILYEGSNNILFQYLDTIFGDDNDQGSSATVGLNKGDGQTALQYSYDTPSLSDGLAILYSPKVTPGIRTVTVNPPSLADNQSEMQVVVRITTSGVEDGTTFSLQLTDESGNLVGISATGIINSNEGLSGLNIPLGFPIGNYYIRVSINGFNTIDRIFMIGSGLNTTSLADAGHSYSFTTHQLDLFMNPATFTDGSTFDINKLHIGDGTKRYTLSGYYWEIQNFSNLSPGCFYFDTQDKRLSLMLTDEDVEGLLGTVTALYTGTQGETPVGITVSGAAGWNLYDGVVEAAATGDKPLQITDWCTDTEAPSAIYMDYHNSIYAGDWVTLTAEGGPLSDQSWANILTEIQNHTGINDGIWITGIDAADLKLYPDRSGKTAKLKNNNYNAQAFIIADFVIPADIVVDRAGNPAASNIIIDSYDFSSGVYIYIPAINYSSGNEVVTVSEPKANEWISAIPTLKGTVSNIDGDLKAVKVRLWREQGDEYYYYCDDPESGYLSYDPFDFTAEWDGNEWSLELPDTDFDSGQYHIEAWAEDEWPGTPARITFYVDKTIPLLDGINTDANDTYQNGNRIFLHFNEPVLKSEFSMIWLEDALAGISEGITFGEDASISFAEEFNGEYAQMVIISLGDGVNLPSKGLSFSLPKDKVVDRGGNMAADDVVIELPELTAKGNETAVITSPAAEVWLNTDLEIITGTATNIDGDLKNVKVRILNVDSQMYLSGNHDAVFNSVMPVDLEVDGTTDWTVTLSGVEFEYGRYMIQAIAYDGENGIEGVLWFNVDKKGPVAGEFTDARPYIVGDGHSYETGDKIIFSFNEPVKVDGMNLSALNDALQSVSPGSSFGSDALISPRPYSPDSYEFSPYYYGEVPAGYADTFEVTLGTDASIPAQGLLDSLILTLEDPAGNLADVHISIPEITSLTGNEDVSIITPSEGSYLLGKPDCITGTATSIDGDLNNIRVYMVNISTGKYLNANDGDFSSNGIIDLIVQTEGEPSAPGSNINWTVDLAEAQFEDGCYQVIAQAYDAEGTRGGPVRMSQFTVDTTKPALDFIQTNAQTSYKPGDRIWLYFSEPVQVSAITLDKLEAALDGDATFGSQSTLCPLNERNLYSEAFMITLGADANIPAAGVALNLASRDIIDRAGNTAEEDIFSDIPNVEGPMREEITITLPIAGGWINNLDEISGTLTNKSGVMSSVKVSIRDSEDEYLTYNGFDGTEFFWDAELYEDGDVIIWTVSLPYYWYLHDDCYSISAYTEFGELAAESFFYLDQRRPMLENVYAVPNRAGGGHTYESGDQIMLEFSEPIDISRMTLNMLNTALNEAHPGKTFGTTGASVMPLYEERGYAPVFVITLGDGFNISPEGFDFYIPRSSIKDRAGNIGQMPV